MESKGKLVPKNERILRAAEAVFSKKGYRQATLDEIVKIADTGKGTVYKYFNNEMYPLYWTPSKEGTFCVIRLNLS